MERSYINEMWNKNLGLLKESINGFKRLTTHTLTFNQQMMIENEVHNYKRFLEKYISLLKTYKGDENVNYFYCFEISGTQHLHIHLVINLEFTGIQKSEIRKKGNKGQNWPFYNENGVVISSSNNELSGVTSCDLENICEYFTKDLKNIKEDLYKLYYILFPLKIMSGGGSFFGEGENYEIIKIMGNLLFALEYKLMYEFKIYAPIYKLKGSKGLKLIEDYYEEGRHVFERSCDKNFLELEKVIKSLDLNSEKEKCLEVQNKINEFSKQGVNSLNVFNLHSKDFKFFLMEFVKKLEKSRKSKLFDVFIQFIDLKTIFVYVLDALIRTLIKENLHNEEMEKDIEDFGRLKGDIKKNRFLESRFKYYFSTIYKYNVFKCYIVNDILDFYKSTKKKSTFSKFLSKIMDLEEFKDLKEFNRGLYGCYKVMEGHKNLNRFYVINGIEDFVYNEELYVQLTLLFDDILQVLYEIGLFKKVDIESKIHYFELTSEVFKKMVNFRYVSHMTLPNVIIPEDFESKVINEDPFILLNENLNFISKVGKKKIELINKMQKISFRIDNNYLNYLFHLSSNELKGYQDSINLLAFEERYDEKNIDKNDYKFDGSQYFLCLDFFLQLRLATLMKGKKFGFTRFMDSRHRVYLRQFPLKFDGSTLLRPLFIFSKRLNVSLKDRLINFPFFYDYLKNPKVEDYIKFGLFKNPFDSLIGFDASSQVFQLQGSFILDEKMLKLTKVLKVKDEEEELKLGFYEFLLKKCLLKCGDFKDIKKILKEAYNKMKELNVKQLEKYEEEFLGSKIEKRINRKWVKEILMTYGYNKSVVKLCDTTLKGMFDLEVLSKESLRFYSKIANLLTYTLIKCLNENFKGLSFLRALFRSLASLGGLFEGTYININKDMDYGIQEDFSLQFYFLRELIKVQKGVKGKNYTDNYYINVPKKERKIDFRKSLNALLPNVTHHVDALLMFFTVEFLLKKNIDVIAIHDSFYVSHIYSKEVKEAYVNALIRVFSEDILLILIRNNLYMGKISNKNSDFSVLLNKIFLDFNNFDLQILKNFDKEEDLNPNQIKFLKLLKKVSTSYFSIKNLRNFDNSKFSSLLKESFNPNILS